MKTKSKIILMAALLLAIGIPTSFIVASNLTGDNEVKAADAETTYHFYNQDLQKDDDPLNNYDFGPNPILEHVSMEKIQEALKGKKTTDTIKISDILKILNAEEIREDQIKRLKVDPKLGAADMAWMDALLGTRFMGVFYSAAKNQWDVAMNDASDSWISDKEAYKKVVENFEKKLKAANKIELKYLEGGIEDQMYMEPLGKTEGIPDIIVMDSDKHSGWFIVYTYIIKETKTIEVAYRVDCGYQPCNVAKVMNIQPKKRNVTIVKSAPSDSDPGPGSDPGDPDPGSDPSDPEPSSKKPSKPKDPDPKPDEPKDPDPKSNEPKDPSKGTQVQENDNTGPGKNTNGGEKSSEEKPGNSGDMTQKEYEKAIEENKEANEISREGGDSNTPSVTPDPAAKQDNNGDTGNGGNPGIDTPTDKSDSSVSNDKSGDHWDGPPE